MTLRITDILKAVGAAAASLAIFTSCDDVKEDDRYIEVDEVLSDRVVLLEDFTGQNCLNCADAHVVMEQLEEQWGDRLVAVSIHCGDFGMPVSRTRFDIGRVGLMTEEGNTILSSYPIISFPRGVVDMGTPLNFDAWAGAIYDAVAIPTNVSIDLKAEYIPDERDGEEGYFGTISMSADVISTDSQTANVQFWVVEDGIVARQRLSDGSYNEQYVHNNVFRGMAFDSLNGEAVNLEHGISKNVSTTIPTRWNEHEHWEVRNLEVVALVTGTNGLLQVAKVPLFKDEQNPE